MGTYYSYNGCRFYNTVMARLSIAYSNPTQREGTDTIHHHAERDGCVLGSGCLRINYYTGHCKVADLGERTTKVFGYSKESLEYHISQVMRISNDARQITSEGDDNMGNGFNDLYHDSSTHNRWNQAHGGPRPGGVHLYVLEKIIEALKTLLGELKEVLDTYDAVWAEERAELVEKIAAGENLDLRAAEEQFRHGYNSKNNVRVETTRGNVERTEKTIKKFELMSGDDEGRIVLTDEEFNALGI